MNHTSFTWKFIYAKYILCAKSKNYLVSIGKYLILHENEIWYNVVYNVNQAFLRNRTGDILQVIKTYFNDAVIGNSGALGCITARGELVRLFWPNIDYPQHFEQFYNGIFFMGRHDATHRYDSTRWFHDDIWGHFQCYKGDTNILETVCTSAELGLRVSQMDFAVPGEDMIVRSYEIENIGEELKHIGFMSLSSFFSTNQHMGNSLFNFELDCLIHYEYGYYAAIAADRETYQFQLGNNASSAACNTWLNGYDDIGMMPDAAVSWDLGEIMPGCKLKFNLYICMGKSIKEAKNNLRNARCLTAGVLFDRTEKYWLDFLARATKVNTGRDDIDSLYRRSILVFKLMADEKTGGLLAAPEADEGFTKCGRYAYCWGRDAAFITTALDACGLYEAVDRFYEWAVEVQDESGSWLQRYHMDGNIAPSWGLQVDETGTLLWGMLQHYRVTGDTAFLKKMWESVRLGADFLYNFIDDKTGLPAPSFDLWEERRGEHAYSSAAVCAGLKAACDISTELERIERQHYGEERQHYGEEGQHNGGEKRYCGTEAQYTAYESLWLKWEAGYLSIKEAIERNMWDEGRKCFLRSIHVKLNPWGNEHSADTEMITINPKGYQRDATRKDYAVDISLLGLCVPFGVFDEKDDRIRLTVEEIERKLICHGIGGIKRYENDNYMGGNPWVITTLWLALYYIKAGDYSKALSSFEWAVRSKTGLNLLPEQVDREKGGPAWIIPLTWSHAMFVLVLFELMAARVIEGNQVIQES